MSLKLLSSRVDLYEYIYIEQLIKHIDKHAKDRKLTLNEVGDVPKALGGVSLVVT